MATFKQSVYFWPDSSDSIPLNQDLIVIALDTLPTTLRFQARKLIRIAIKQVLAKILGCTLDEIELTFELGQAPRLSQPKHNIGLSISHESGLTIAAIHLNGKVGVDLLASKTIPDKGEIETLALEYLGAQTAEHLSRMANLEQKLAFAQAWTAFEARLKCEEKNLTEWTASSALQLNMLKVRSLILPDGYIGTIAFSD